MIFMILLDISWCYCNEKRNRLGDYTYAIVKTSMAVMTPKPVLQESNILIKIWNPFQPQVIQTIYIWYLDFFFVNKS